MKTNAKRNRFGYQAAITGICLNIVLFLGKLFAGIISQSVSITADAFNNLSDAGSSVVTLIGFKIASSPPDKEHPFGHGRAEYVSGLVVSFFILLMGFELGKSSIEKLLSPTETTFGTLTFLILIVSSFVKLFMFFFYRRIGIKINSTAVKAASLDSLSDTCATFVVLTGAVIANLTGYNPDPWIGLFVSIFIFYSGLKTAKDSLSPILGEKPDTKLVKEIEKTVMDYAGILGVHDLIIHNYGENTKVLSLHAEVPDSMDLVQAHRLIDAIENELKQRYQCLATIHMDPMAVYDEETISLRDVVKTIVYTLDPSLTIHDFRIDEQNDKKTITFDLVIPYRFSLSEEATIQYIQDKLYQIDTTYTPIINIDRGTP